MILPMFTLIITNNIDFCANMKIIQPDQYLVLGSSTKPSAICIKLVYLSHIVKPFLHKNLLYRSIPDRVCVNRKLSPTTYLSAADSPSRHLCICNATAESGPQP